MKLKLPLNIIFIFNSSSIYPIPDPEFKHHLRYKGHFSLKQSRNSLYSRIQNYKPKSK
jgi:hypothetical protein